MVDEPILHEHCYLDTDQLRNGSVGEGSDGGFYPADSRSVGTPYRRRAGTGRASEIAARARDYLQANLHRPVEVEEVRLAVGVPLRTLHHAFKSSFKTSPIRYHSLRRLAMAHADLERASPRSTTVTKIALNWGFCHFGRFSVSYKALIGESPSETLARGRQR